MRRTIVFAIIFIIALSSCAEKALKSEDIAEMFGRIPLADIPEKYSPDEAIENGDYVDVHGMITNGEVMTGFLAKVEKGEKAFIRTTSYTIEGDPIIYDFYYDGEKFIVTTDHTRDAFGGANLKRETKEYRYLKTHSLMTEHNYEYNYLVVTNEESFDDIIYFPGENSVILKTTLIFEKAD